MTIRMEDVTVFPPRSDAMEYPLLHRINTAFEPGSITLLAGRSGSGKSTFLHTLAGLLPIATGGIRYGGIPLWTEKKRIHPQVGSAIGIAFQYPERQLFAENVRKELLYSLRPMRWSKADKEQAVKEALHSVNLPFTILEEPVLSLSEGTKRKVAFAATVVARPKWLLLDEPTSGMDSEGIQPLLQLLKAHRAAGGGVIVASHDLESFLPVADRVLLLKEGTITADLTPQQCCDAPGLLVQAEVGWPEQVQLAEALRAQGIDLERCPLTPEEAAAAIMKRRGLNGAARSVAIASLHAEVSVAAGVSVSTAVPAIPQQGNMNPPVVCGEEVQRTAALAKPALAAEEPWLNRLDPIAKWISYVCLSAGVLMQHQWYGIAAAALLCTIIAALSGGLLRIFRSNGIRFFVVFIVLSGTLSGLSIELSPLRLGFQSGPAFVTVKLLLRFLLIMALGLLLMATTSEYRMQKALEQAFRPLERYKFPAKLVTFTAALMLRFVAMLQVEIERLSLIVTARGKAYVKPGTIRLRDVRLFFIPLLLSMMKHAEDLAFALEARGYKTRAAVAHTIKPVTFQWRDKLTIAAGVVLLAFLWVIAIVG